MSCILPNGVPSEINLCGSTSEQTTHSQAQPTNRGGGTPRTNRALVAWTTSLYHIIPLTCFFMNELRRRRNGCLPRNTFMRQLLPWAEIPVGLLFYCTIHQRVSPWTNCGIGGMDAYSPTSWTILWIPMLENRHCQSHIWSHPGYGSYATPLVDDTVHENDRLVVPI